MSTAQAAVWVAALAFLAFVTVGWGRLYRFTTTADDDFLGFLLFGGMGLLAVYGIVLGPTYYLVGGAA